MKKNATHIRGSFNFSNVVKWYSCQFAVWDNGSHWILARSSGSMSVGVVRRPMPWHPCPRRGGYQMWPPRRHPDSCCDDEWVCRSVVPDGWPGNMSFYHEAFTCARWACCARCASTLADGGDPIRIRWDAALGRHGHRRRGRAASSRAPKTPSLGRRTPSVRCMGLKGRATRGNW